jgi:hypothetical protein
MVVQSSKIIWTSLVLAGLVLYLLLLAVYLLSQDVVASFAKGRAGA